MRKLVGYAALLWMGGVLVSTNVVAGSSNPEETARENTKIFIDSTRSGRAKCVTLAKQTFPASTASHTPAELESCVSALKDDADRRFKLLPSALGTKSDALTHAKDYYAYWQTSLSDVTPKEGEAQEAYASRQSESLARLTELQKGLEAAVP